MAQLKTFACATLLAVLCILPAAQPAGAREREKTPEQITPGMTYQDVVTLWGAPLEKLERESRREDVWVYPQVEVRFKEGKALAARYRAGFEPPKKESAPEELLTQEPFEPYEPDGGKVQVQDILGEIVGEDEHAAEKKGGGPGKPGAPAAGNPMRPMAPAPQKR